MVAFCEQISGARRRADREPRDFPSATTRHEEYLTARVCKDGIRGEIFITASK
jgi:hypothetical protein